MACWNQAGTLLGVLPVYWGTSGRGFYSPFDMFLAPTSGPFRESDWSPTYVVGSRFAYDCEFLVDAALPAEDRRPYFERSRPRRWLTLEL